MSRDLSEYGEGEELIEGELTLGEGLAEETI